MSRFLTRLVVVAAVVAATAVSAAVGARAFGPMTVCTKFTGPAWKVTSISGTVTRGKVYEVAVDKAPCAFAKTWAVKFAKTPTHGNYLLKGPAGWRCRANFGFSQVWAWNGRCEKGTAQAFAWGPKTR